MPNIANSPTITYYTMIPPWSVGTQTTKVNGRSYTCTGGSLLSAIPGFDAHVLEANGWIKTTNAGSGTTAQRPAAPKIGQTFYDSTVGANVIWNGSIWAHSTTGASS